MPEPNYGTPQYKAPEVALGQSSAASDVYSLGLTILSMLTGQLPFPEWGNELVRACVSVSVYVSVSVSVCPCLCAVAFVIAFVSAQVLLVPFATLTICSFSLSSSIANAHPCIRKGQLQRTLTKAPQWTSQSA